MTKPLAPRNPSPNFSDHHPDLEFATSSEDGRYHAEVQRTSESTGNFYIFDRDDGDKELKCSEVHLAYGSSYVADITDVRTWLKMAEDFVERLKD